MAVMKPLLAFVDQHPAATRAVGATSGALSWFLAHTSDITGVAGAIGAVATAFIAGVTALRLVYVGVCHIAAAVRRYRRIREARRPWTEDDFPL